MEETPCGGLSNITIQYVFWARAVEEDGAGIAQEEETKCDEKEIQFFRKVPKLMFGEEEGKNRVLIMSELELEMGRKKEAGAIRASMATNSSACQKCKNRFFKKDQIGSK